MSVSVGHDLRVVQRLVCYRCRQQGGQYWDSEDCIIYFVPSPAIMCSSEDIGIGAIGFFSWELVVIAVSYEPLTHLLTSTEFLVKSRIEPWLVYPEFWIDEESVPVESFDIVSLVGTTVTPYINSILHHRLYELGSCYCSAERCSIEVCLSSSFDMKSRASNCEESFIHKCFTAVDQSRSFSTVCEGTLWYIIIVIFIILSEIGCICVWDCSFWVHPRDSTTGVKSTRKGDTNFGAYRKRREDMSHKSKNKKIKNSSHTRAVFDICNKILSHNYRK